MFRSYYISERISSSLKDFQYDPAYSGSSFFNGISSKLFPKTILTVELMSSPEKS